MKLDLNEIEFWDETCSVYQLFDTLWKKWSLSIIYLIWENISTFNLIMRKLSKINSKVLSDRLDDLVEKELVIRKVSLSKPLKVNYILTEKWIILQKKLAEIWDWVLSLDNLKEKK